MNLSHYSDSDVLSPHSVHQDGDPERMKPSGLWVSVDGPEDWPWWCTSEQFRDIDAQHHWRITLAESNRVLVLSSVADLEKFNSEYRDRWDWGYIRWADVARKWSGIIIAPYQWEYRFGPLWYYSWDCASGCIWDASDIESVDLMVRADR